MCKQQKVTRVFQIDEIKTLCLVFLLFGSFILIHAESSTSTVSTQAENLQPRVRNIKGVVIDQYGEPIIGATIVDKGTKVGTITDYNGGFTLEVTDNSVLQISYIGYTPVEMKVGSRQALRIQLQEDVLALEEVVVVGYGSQKKINVTGAIAQVSAKELADRPVANLSQMLQGAIPNLNVNFSSGRPGATGSLNIRGNTSLTGGSPLILIDGIEGSLDRINPNDVETVTILKDASASAIYGARASFGVILISTKKGQVGKMNVSYNGRYSFSAATTSTDFETRGYYSAKINDDFLRSYAGQNYTKYTEDDYNQLWLRVNDKTEHPDRPWVTIDQRDGRDTYVYYANFDFYNYMYDNKRPTKEHNISISGGNELTQYSISGNFYDQQGIVKLNPDEFNRVSFRSAIATQVKPWLNVKNTTRYYKQTYSFPGWSTINDLFKNTSYSSLASFVPQNPDGTFVYTTSLMNYRYAEGRHAVALDGHHNNDDNWNDFSTTFEAKLNVLKNLDIIANYSFSEVTYQTIKRTDKLVYSQYPGEILQRTDDIGINRLTEYNSVRWYNATNLYGIFRNSFGDNNITVTAGANYETQFIKDLTAQREGLLTTELSDFNLAQGDVMNISGGKNSYAIMGAFYRVNYDFKGKYLFETSGRYDGSSRFQRGSRFGFFPSASIGWRASEESFFHPLSTIVDDMKIRYSYGALGNQQNLGYYDYMQVINTANTMNYSLGDGSKVQYASASSPNSAALSWEKVYTNNIGIDLLFLRQRLSFTGDMYSRMTKGMLTKGKTLPSAYGAAFPKENAADLKTNGWELSLGWKDSFKVLGKPFVYAVNFGLSDYTAVITKFDNPTKLLSDFYVGQKLGDIWGYHVDGFFISDEEAADYLIDQQSVNNIINSSAGSERGLKAGDLKYLDLDGDNVISIGKNTADEPGDRTIIGNSQPRYSYGFNFSTSWSGFDLAMFFQGIGKQDWYPGTSNMAFWGPYSRPFASFIPSNFMNDVWSEENPNTYFPRPRGYIAFDTNRALGAVNNRYMQDLAYIRLKNLTFGYTIPNNILPKKLIENVRIYFSGENLLTKSKLRSKYIDPEQATNDSNNGRVYPWSKTFSFGVDVKF